LAGKQNRDSGASYEDDDDDGESFDLSALRDYLGYALRAVRLHKVLAASVFVGIVAATFGILRTLPRTWHIETKVTAQKEVILGQGNPFGSDPMKGVSDIVMAHEHLLSLVKQLDLTTWWRETSRPRSASRRASWRRCSEPPPKTSKSRSSSTSSAHG